MKRLKASTIRRQRYGLTTRERILSAVRWAFNKPESERAHALLATARLLIEEAKR